MINRRFVSKLKKRIKNSSSISDYRPSEGRKPTLVGRCVAGDKISHAATRQMCCCIVIGQGAGVAAAISYKDKVSCRDVSMSKVQTSLKKQGVRIE